MDDSKNKVGSSNAAAGKVVNENDFGAHESDVTERNYVSEETKVNDKGGGIERSGFESRTSGVGGNEGGRGNSSGGDADVDDAQLVGIGDPDKMSPKPRQTAAKPGERPVLNPPVVAPDPTGGGVHDNASSTSAADVNNETQQTGNSFKGDVTADEATGGA